MGLYQKIHEVMKDVQYLQKDDNVSTGGTGSYKAISEEKVTETVRASLIKHGLIILPVEQEHKRDDTPVRTEKTYQGKTEIKETISRLSTVNTRYKIIDIETGEAEFVVSSGTGVDTQDKGVGKAMTYSYKYLLLRSFAIPTGDDPDKISSDGYSEKLGGNTSKNIKPNIPDSKEPQKELSVKEAAELTITFGKHTGKTLGELYKTDKGYIKWLVEKSTDEKIKKAIQVLIIACKAPTEIPPAEMGGEEYMGGGRPLGVNELAEMDGIFDGK
jgi:hypothetical protein